LYLQGRPCAVFLLYICNRNMNPTRKIQLEIYSAKADKFYLALLKNKLSGKADLETLKELADAIHFDKDSLANSFDLSEEKKKAINNKLSEIHAYLLASKRDSKDYFTVSKENLEKFLESPFGKELYDMFFMMEMMKQWAGKEESAEVKATAAMMSWFISGLMQGMGEAIGKSMSKTVNAAIAFNDKRPFTVKPNKKGNLVFQREDETIETEIYLEKDGAIRKKDFFSENDMSADVTSFFMRSDDTVMQVKEQADHFEITRYENVKAKNRKLDLTKASVIEKISIPKDGVESTEVTVENTEPIVYNYADMLRQQDNSKENASIEVQSQDSIFAMLDENFISYLKLPQSNPEKIQARNKLILGIYELTVKHYSGFTPHAYATITGFIASRMELLDTQAQHDETKRTQPYRKYLRDSVTNILKTVQ
jgi:hypothetical protein